MGIPEQKLQPSFSFQQAGYLLLGYKALQTEADGSFQLSYYQFAVLSQHCLSFSLQKAFTEHAAMQEEHSLTIMKTTFLVLHTAVMCFQRGSTVDDVPQTFQLLPATAWCPSGMYLQPNHPLWHFQNKAITHHLPPSATKTRGHAVQASC